MALQFSRDVRRGEEVGIEPIAPRAALSIDLPLAAAGP